MNFLKRPSKNGDKITFYYDFGRGKGQRPTTDFFIYTKAKNQAEKNHNRDALLLLETKKSQLIIEQQAIGSAFNPTYKFKANFLDNYEENVTRNSRNGIRLFTNSLNQFRLFIGTDFI